MQKIDEAVKVLAAGGIIIVVDDADRENEGDFLALGDNIQPETVNFMVTNGRGLLCTPISEGLASHFALGPMTEHNTERNGTAFTVSIDGEYLTTGVTTGISAGDRAATIRQLAKEEATREDFVQPGHVFPLVARPGGVRERPGHTEAAIEFAKLAKKKELAVIIEILLPNGQMARQKDLQALAEKWQIPLVHIRELIQHLEEERNG
ncbi:3,4-dihydroxy-2-butanone-4-phosphate synthase [Fructobacillus papyrifericola]|uniref:3,4-dihydroxy-2-butanone 4-phosphate synthase n=1 Tax=Fructobacillus papyrifericola TaxID=2713172 RepID=A0ABS5QVJ3_9LACO|nr:3,4-dihydroxy-2-butanone-4-phosphate synthase [Fructobacillus papyrifericola]MBS9336575.1 3,4-dihydroxy-2-butanone-4-phosphate synthase [Fructobacillus papyrifericola]